MELKKKEIDNKNQTIQNTKIWFVVVSEYAHIFISLARKVCRRPTFDSRGRTQWLGIDGWDTLMCVVYIIGFYMFTRRLSSE